LASNFMLVHHMELGDDENLHPHPLLVNFHTVSTIAAAGETHGARRAVVHRRRPFHADTGEFRRPHAQAPISGVNENERRTVPGASQSTSGLPLRVGRASKASSQPSSDQGRSWRRCGFQVTAVYGHGDVDPYRVHRDPVGNTSNLSVSSDRRRFSRARVARNVKRD
jgi:hypothetical protein